MISNWKYITLFVGVSIGFYCCGSEKNIRQQAAKDIYGHPIGFLLEDNKNIYYTEKGKKIITYIGEIEFNEGKDSLAAYLNDVYYNHPSYNYEEYNMWSLFFILFDKNLNIVEVRIMKRPRNEEFYYDSIFIEALKSTAGMWHKTVEGKEWYIYLHGQRIW